MECLICNKPLVGEVSNITKVGLEALLKASKIRNDGKYELFQRRLEEGNLKLHVSCRKDYTRSSSLQKARKEIQLRDGTSAGEEPARLLRSQTCDTFDLKERCFICGEIGNADVEKKKRKEVRREINLSAEPDKILNVRSVAQARRDDLGNLVLCRLAVAADLVAADVRYHKDCYKRFMSSLPSSKTSGRPVDPLRAEAFRKVCEYMEDSDDCQFSLLELEELMKSFLPVESQSDTYTTKRLRQKLSDYFGEQVIFTELSGLSTIVCFRETADQIIHDLWVKGKTKNKDEERAAVVLAAATILREEIRSVPYDNAQYCFDGSNIDEESRISPLVRTFVNSLTVSKKTSAKAYRRRVALCDLMTTACRPNSFISPLLLGIGVYLHRNYESKKIIDILHSVGLSVSYDEARRCEFSLMIADEEQSGSEGFVQFAFDNADINVRTLDGHGTFHNMGGIMYETPRASRDAPKEVPRFKTVPKKSDWENVAKDLQGRMGVISYEKPNYNGLSKVPIRRVELVDVRDKSALSYPALSADALWMVNFLFSDTAMPSWNGFMQESSSGEYTVSSTKILPCINRNPSDPNTIFTALTFAADECKKLNQPLCSVTFDQPLFAKAAQIVADDGSSGPLSKVVVRLGGFHLLMSFLGAIGKIMEGSGLAELWTTIYAKNSVDQMMEGRAYARSVRAHILTDLALHLEILKDSEIPVEWEAQLHELQSKMLAEKMSPLDVSREPALSAVMDELAHTYASAKDASRTGEYWVQYMGLVDLLRLYLRSERTGDWGLHLLSIRQMIPAFYSAGHLPHAKSARLYLQILEDLPARFDRRIVEKFTSEGFFTIRRADRFWSGISPDLGIEQGVMRAMKTAGGISGGRGITESTLTTWVSAIPRCIPMCDSLETFCGVRSESSEQHKEMRDSRQERDRHDLTKLSDWLSSHPPFARREKDELVSLSTGMIANQSVKCDQALAVGKKAMESLTGKNFSEITLKRKDKFVSLAAMSRTIKVRDKNVEIRPEQFFHRLIFVCAKDEDKKEAFSHELAPQPAAFFNDGMMRKIPKSKLADALEIRCPCDEKLPLRTSFVVDGGQLLYSMTSWTRNTTYLDISQQYSKYVVRKYGKACKVIFDGYRGPPSTKSAEQRRRTQLKSSVTVDVRPNLPLTTTCAEFLANYANKAQFIDLLIETLRSDGIRVYQASADADVFILTTALDMSSAKTPVAVVAKDTDILAILIARATNRHSLFMYSPGGANRGGHHS